jgi:hypothetical protein
MHASQDACWAWVPGTLTTRDPNGFQCILRQCSFRDAYWGTDFTHRYVLCLPDTFSLKLHSLFFAARTNFASTMSSESLEFWTSGRKGTLSRKSQAQIWALTHVSELRSLHLTQEEIAGAVKKIGGGSPSQRAISDLQATIREDSDWYPGKNKDLQDQGGRPKLFTPQKQQACANAAMAIKRAGKEPSAAAVAARCPIAAVNPETSQPFSNHLLTKVFRSKCYDNVPENPWGHMTPYYKTALSPQHQEMRYQWAGVQQGLEHSPAWYLQHVAFIDPCNTILSPSLKTGFDETQASYGRCKRWMSSDSRRSSRNLRASPYATKQARSGDMNVWWFVILARGKVGYVVMRDGWMQTGAGMGEFLQRLEAKLQLMVGRGARLPRTLCSDRGPGFYQGSSGHIVEEYRVALQRTGFRAYAGDDASQQPSDMADFWPHETAVSWIRTFMRKHPLQKTGGVEQMRKDFVTTMDECMRHINREHDVEGLCRSFPKRLAELRSSKGERMKY